MMGKIKPGIQSLIMFFCLGIVALLIFTGKPVYATAINTANTSVPKAVVLKDNVKQVGKFVENGTSQYYKWTASATGYVEFHIDRYSLDNTENAKWTFYLYDSKMNQCEYKDYFSNSYISCTYMVTKGTTYLIRIEKIRASISGSLEVLYSVNAEFKPYAYVGCENNNTLKKATKLNIGKTYLGNLIRADDVDMYKITAAKTGYFSLAFNRKDYINEGAAYWKITLFDSKGREQDNFFGEGLNNFKFALQKGKSIYIKVSTNKYYNEGVRSINKIYKIKTSFKECLNIESEPNDKFSTADKIKLNTGFYGSLLTTSSDYYYFVPTSKGKYKVRFSLGNSEAENGYKVSIYDSSRRLIKQSDVIYHEYEYLSFNVTKGKRYYIVISHSNNYDRQIGILYNIKAYKSK